jgi:hypothetical protein
LVGFVRGFLGIMQPSDSSPVPTTAGPALGPGGAAAQEEAVDVDSNAAAVAKSSGKMRLPCEFL